MGIWATRDVLRASSDGSLRRQECRQRNDLPPRLCRSRLHLPNPARANRLRPETTSTRKCALDPATSHCRSPRSAVKEVFVGSLLVLTTHLVVTMGPKMELRRAAKAPTILPTRRPNAPAAAVTAAATSSARAAAHARYILYTIFSDAKQRVLGIQGCRSGPRDDPNNPKQRVRYARVARDSKYYSCCPVDLTPPPTT
jgi:hypothetical protein